MSLLIIAPPRAQWSPNSMSVPMMMSWIYTKFGYDKIIITIIIDSIYIALFSHSKCFLAICQRAVEILAYYRFGDFTVEFDWL